MDSITLGLLNKFNKNDAVDFNALKNRPTKLSDLENDLFYNKMEPFLTLKKEDFIINSEFDSMYFEYHEKIDWLTSIDSIWFKLTDGVSEEESNTITWDEINEKGDIVYREEDIGDGIAFQIVDCGLIAFLNGINGNDAPEDVFTVIINGVSDLPPYLLVEIYKHDRKQIKASEIDYSTLPFIRSDNATELSEESINGLVEQLDIENRYDACLTGSNSTIQRTIPIIKTTGNGSNYNLGKISVDKIPDSFLLMIIPHVDSNITDPKANVEWEINTETPTRVINITYILHRIGDGSTGDSGLLKNKSSLKANNPIIVLLNSYQKYMYILNLSGERFYNDSRTATCYTNSNIVRKDVNADGKFDFKIGSNIYVKFKYKNTADNPTLNVDRMELPIVDKTGNAIAADALESDKYYHFVALSNKWMLMDDTYTVNTQLSTKISTPCTASIGQTIIVKAIDENGMPTEWEAVDPMIVHSSTEGSTKKFKISIDDSGVISATEVIE